MKSNFFFWLSLLALLFLPINCRVGVEQRRKLIQAIPFEALKWNDSAYENRVQFRPGMARKLVADKSLMGKGRIEIVEMLGEDSHFSSQNLIVYELEDIYGSNIDPIAIEYLKITFDQKDKVEKAEIEFVKTHDWRD